MNKKPLIVWDDIEEYPSEQIELKPISIVTNCNCVFCKQDSEQSAD